MEYKNNNYKNRGNQYNRNFGNSSNEQNYTPMIDKPLSEYYADKAELYLENGTAYKMAEKLVTVAPHQLRKYLDTVKDCAKMDDFSAARNRLYSIVPLAAYNAGRDSKQTALYYFIKSNINKDTLRNAEDIDVLDELFTSILAYHKFLNTKR